MVDTINEPVTPVVESSVEVTPTPEITPTESPVQAVTTETPVEQPTEAPRSETVLGEALEVASTEALDVTEEAPVEKPEEITPEETPEKVEVSEEQKNEGGQSEETAPPPKYDPWVLPEGIKLDEERIGEFSNLLAELETSGKATHEAVQAFGQKAVEFHINEVKKTVEQLTDYYQKTWEKQKTDWKESFLKDPDIGGNRFQTTVDSALTFIRTHGGTPEQQKEFRSLMETSGLGNHPAMIRLLANAGRAMSEGRPIAATKPVSQSKSKTATLYGGK